MNDWYYYAEIRLNVEDSRVNVYSTGIIRRTGNLPAKNLMPLSQYLSISCKVVELSSFIATLSRPITV